MAVNDRESFAEGANLLCDWRQSSRRQASPTIAKVFDSRSLHGVVPPSTAGTVCITRRTEGHESKLTINHGIIRNSICPDNG